MVFRRCRSRPVNFIQAIPLSNVAKQHALLGEKFAERYADAWLVWEPGRWNAPELRIQPPDTVWPPAETSSKPPRGEDPLCFPLPSVAVGEVVGVGRAPGNAIVVNDATVSRRHVAFSKDASGSWHVEVVSDTKMAIVQNEKLTAPAKVPIPSGGKIQLGEVLLSFHSSADFVTRLTGG
jgi:hypothetical protein